MVINFVLLIVSIVLRRSSFRYPLAAIILATAFPAALPKLQTTPPPLTQTDSLFKVLSYNVRLFDLYNWNPDPNTTRDILHFLNTEKNDVICLQEYYSNESKKFTPVDSIRLKGGYTYAYISYANGKTKLLNNGLAIFSKHNIINSGAVKFSNTYNFFIYTDIILNRDTIRIYNAHLESVHLSYTEYQLFSSMEQSDKSKSEQIEELVNKIRTAFRKRVFQVTELKKHARQCKHPVIICADLNDTPMSFAYNKLSRHYTDAWLEKGTGWGSTYNSIIPFFRIDYIMHSPDLALNHFHIFPFQATDHFPIQAQYHIK